MAAVLEITTAHRLNDGDRPRLTLVESPVNLRRIYMRRRITVGAVSLVVLVASFLGLSGLRGATTGSATTFDTHRIRSGETLWSIARETRPGQDPRDTIAAIVALNSTDAVRFDPWAPISVGQTIRVPTDR